MTQDDKPIRKEALDWLASQVDRLMTDPDVLEVMPREDVYRELGQTEADLKPAIDAIRRQLGQAPAERARSRFAIIHALRPKTGLRWAVAASLVLVVLYGGLWLIGRSALPETFALAAVTDYERELSGAVRSPTSPGDLAQGAGALLAAPQNTLGLFPRYDQVQAARAITHLEPAYEAAADPFQRERIAFYLAKAYLMQENVVEARAWLEKALAQNATGYREEAEALRREIDEL